MHLGASTGSWPSPQTHSLSPNLTWLPPYSGSSTLSPSLTPTGSRSPSLLRRPGPTATTRPSLTCANRARRAAISDHQHVATRSGAAFASRELLQHLGNSGLW